MLLRRYGSQYHSVEMNFDSKALNEIGFRRDRQQSFDVYTFPDTFERVSEHDFDAHAEGEVHDEVEQAVLSRLEEQVVDLMDSLAHDQVIVIQSEQGASYPKTRQATRKVIRDGENRLHFTVHIEPPLHLAVYRRTS